MLRGEKERKTIGPVWKRDRLERREHGPRGAAAGRGRRGRGGGEAHREEDWEGGRERERENRESTSDRLPYSVLLRLPVGHLRL